MVLARSQISLLHVYERGEELCFAITLKSAKDELLLHALTALRHCFSVFRLW